MIDFGGILQWMAGYWPGRSRELARQYAVMAEQCPLVVADLARRCHAFDDVYAGQVDNEGAVPPDRDTFIAIGRRQVWLHIHSMTETAGSVASETLREIDDEYYRRTSSE